MEALQASALPLGDATDSSRCYASMEQKVKAELFQGAVLQGKSPDISRVQTAMISKNAFPSHKNP
jgi:hypothetical protein